MPRERLHFAMPRPVPPGLWRRTPPAVFPALLAGVLLATGWQGGVGAFALPQAAGDLPGGMALALAAFAALAYCAKLARRPAVLIEDLEVLPGQVGVPALALCLIVAAELIGAYWPGAGRVLLALGIGAQLGCLVALIAALARLPAARRRVSPAWHLCGSGLLLTASGAAALGWAGLAQPLAALGACAAVLIWWASLRQGRRERVPPPLRPLLALHLLPLAAGAGAAAALGWQGTASALAIAALVGGIGLGTRGRWLTESGFSSFWAAPAVALALIAKAWVMVWRLSGGEPVRLAAGTLLAAATLLVVPVLFLVLRDWARGRLPARSNAAVA